MAYRDLTATGCRGARQASQRSMSPSCNGRTGEARGNAEAEAMIRRIRVAIAGRRLACVDYPSGMLGHILQ